MKEEILKLRSDGRSYGEISKILGCSKGTISYHCGDGQKEKSDKRRRKRRKNILIGKTERFVYKPNERYKKESVRKFQKRDNDIKGSVNKKIEETFKWVDVLEKFGENTYCYLSGEKVNLYENDYQMDHIIPTSRGGDNSFENLGITHKTVNKMKSDMTPDELLDWCIKILKFNGYKIK